MKAIVETAPQHRRRLPGPLVTHQGERPIPADDPGRELIFQQLGRLPLVEHPKSLGAALGVVELVDVHDNQTGFGCCFEPRPCSPWAMPDHHHLALASPRWFPEPIPYRGALGLREFPDELIPKEYRT